MKESKKPYFRPVAQTLEKRRLLAANGLPEQVGDSFATESAYVSAAAVSTSQLSSGVPQAARAGQAASSSNWVASHRMTSTQYNEEIAKLQRAGLRPYEVSGYVINGQAYYAAIWRPTGNISWQARHGMTSAQYQQEFNTLVGQGYRLTHVNGYTFGGVDYYAAIWDKSSGPQWLARHRMTASQFQSFANDYASQGYRIVETSGYAIGSRGYFSAIWEKRSGPVQVWRFGIDSDTFQEESDEYAAAGFDLVDVSGYTVSGNRYFTGIWEQQSSSDSVWRHDLTSSQYQAEFDSLLDQGYELIDVDGYEDGAIDRYTATWSRPAQSFSDLPKSGSLIPQLSAVQEAVEQFMIERQIPSGTMAISKDGQSLGEVGLGWSDRDRTQTIEPDAMFRLASVTKPMTDAAITKLASQGRIGLDDQVFCEVGGSGDCLLEITPMGNPDPRIYDITVEHLIEHRAGWDRDVSGDPLFNQINIAASLGEPSPPDQMGIARYVLGKPLDFAPGGRYAYSNFGYMVLGLIVEKVTDRDFTEYLQNEIFAPIGVASTEIELGRSLPENRNPREPFYSHASLGSNVFNKTEQVAFPDGAFHLESFESLGGQIASAGAVTRFLDRYWISGDRRLKGTGDYTFYGSLPGTVTMARQRTDGINVVVLLNQRTYASGQSFDLNTLKQRVDAALNGVEVTITRQDTIGLYQPDASLFHLKETFTPGASDQYFAFGPGGNAGWTPLAGDWDGDGVDTIGLYQPDLSLFHLKDSFTAGPSDQYFAFGPGGNAGWIPLAGDWNGDGVDTIGLYEPLRGLFHLKDSFTPGASDQYFAFGPGGNAGWIPLVGDWNGDGIDTIGLYQPDISLFHLKDSFTPGASDQYFVFGPGGNAGWIPMSGDWDGDGSDTIGLYQPSLSLFHLKDSFTSGASDQYFAFGPAGNAGWVPLSGDWNGAAIEARSTSLAKPLSAGKLMHQDPDDSVLPDEVATLLEKPAEFVSKSSGSVNVSVESTLQAPVAITEDKPTKTNSERDEAIQQLDSALASWL